MSHQTPAQRLIKVLRQAGVERVLGVVGDSLHPVVGASALPGGIDWVHVRKSIDCMHVRNQEAGAVCHGRRGAADRAAGGLRR